MRSRRDEFPESVKRAAWARCGGRCECGCLLTIRGTPIYDHYPVPATLGGPGTLDNCRVLDPKCNAYITPKIDIPAIAKSKRIEATRLGLRPKRGRPMPGSKRSGLKKKMNGEVVRR